MSFTTIDIKENTEIYKNSPTWAGLTIISDIKPSLNMMFI